MESLLSPTDVVKMVDIVQALAAKMGCSMHDAVSRIEQLVTGPNSVRRPRSIAAFAERMRAVRARRNDYLKANLFRDPAWDMMLDLYGSDADGRPCSTSALCVGSGAPATTALRHMDRLENAGLIMRRPDRRDHRRTLVDMAPGVKERMETVLTKIQDCY